MHRNISGSADGTLTTVNTPAASPRPQVTG